MLLAADVAIPLAVTAAPDRLGVPSQTGTLTILIILYYLILLF